MYEYFPKRDPVEPTNAAPLSSGPSYKFASFAPEAAAAEGNDDEDANNCEQSDIVMILLNLSAIPDQVAQKFEFKPNFQNEFLKMMEEYKLKFYEDTGVLWEFANDALIQKYLHFKSKKQGLSAGLMWEKGIVDGNMDEQQRKKDD